MNESQHVEWKESWRDDFLKWICGFANADGGMLVVDRNDRGEMAGLKDAPKLLQDLPNKVRDALGMMVEHSGLWVVFRFAQMQEPKTPAETAVKTAVKTPMRILQLLEANPSMTLAEIAAEIGKSLRAVELASSKLVKEGRLRYVGPQKGGHWEVLK